MPELRGPVTPGWASLKSLRTTQGGLDSPSHNLSATLSGHPATEFCETSFIDNDPAEAEIP